MAPFNWAKNFKYEKYEKNIMEEDIIPDDLYNGIQNLISSYCQTNYTTVKNSNNGSVGSSCNDSPGNSNCSCDISGVYCYPANCSQDGNSDNWKENDNGTCTCNACKSIYTKNDACLKDGLETNKPH